MRSVAVIGLGAMGLPIAQRLGEIFSVRGFDVSPGRMRLAAEGGVEVAESAVDVVRGADAILVAVRNGAQLRGLLFDDGGIADHLVEGAVVILTSTVGVDGVADVAQDLRAQCARLVDAPLSGGPVRAREGDLLVIVGAERPAVEAAWPVLKQIAKTVTVVGDKPGDGQALKTVNQLLCGVHIAAAAEALALADALGLDRARSLEALTAGAASSFMLGNRGPRMLQAYDETAPEVLSRLDIFVKDLGIVTAAARQARLSTPVAAAAEQLFLLGESHGLGDLDDSAVVRVIAPERLS